MNTINRDYLAFLAKINTPAGAFLERRNDEPSMAGIAAVVERAAEAAAGVREDLAEMRSRVDAMETRISRPGAMQTSALASDDGERLVQLSNGKQARLLSKSARLSKSAPSQQDEAAAELVDFVAGQVLGRKSVSRGPQLVETSLAPLIIDDVRAQTVIIEAGSRTLAIDGPATAVRITGDATVYQHTEGANDIVASDVSTDGVSLDPKALVARVPLTVELVEDSVNIGQVIRQALAAAFAVKLDALCLATILADANVPKSAADQDPAVWAKCLEAVAAAMAAKQALPTSMVCNTADFIARASQLASTAGSWLGKPPALSAMQELPTTALAAGTALYGGFDGAFMVVVRQELRLEVIRFHDPGRYSHELVAHMRADGVLVQPKRIFKQLKTI